MATIDFKDFELNQTIITGKRKPEVVVDAVRTRYKIDNATKQRTDVQEGYVIDIIAAHGKVQSVKVPMEAKEVIEQITEALKNEKVVKINFGTNASTLRGRCYAMFSNGQLLKGISCTATSINVVSIEEPELEELDEVIFD